MKPLATAAFCLALALLTFFQFPGHTWLQQDTQIYVPILENLRDPAVLRNDMLVQQPHVAYTLYDETALGLRRLTGMDLHQVLSAQQIATRALGIWGLLLLAEAMGLGAAGAVTVAAICSLGGAVAGPSVLTVEYEATPRAFAVPLLLCAMGLAARGRYRAAGIAGAVGALYHAPTALAFWCMWVLLCLWRAKERRERLMAFVPLGAAAVVLRIAAAFQPETQTFISYIAPDLERLQRLRALYVYVSTWPWQTIVHHLLLFAVVLIAAARLRKSMSPDTKAFLVVLPAAGILSMPFSWLLLEQWKWGLVPQVQPMRVLLFATLAMQFLCAAAGVRAGRSAERVAWFALAFLLPLQPVVTGPFEWGRIALAVALGAAAALSPLCAPVVAVAAFLLVPYVGGVVNYPQLHTPELEQMSAWARANTPRDAVFLFPDVPRGLDAGIFRSEAQRAIYVDWKSGGQVNYLKGFGEQWWFRWQQTLGRKFTPSDLPRYEALGIRYVVVRKERGVDRTPVFENARYAVFPLK